MGVSELLVEVCEELGVPTRSVMVDPYLLRIDHAHYQRATLDERISDHEVQFHAAVPGTMYTKFILVARREDGSLWLVDGQHYALAARRVGIPRLRALVFDSNGPQDETRIFNAIQERQGRPLAQARDSL